MGGEVRESGGPERRAAWQRTARAVRVALVVGPVLFVFNHFDHLAHGRWPPNVVVKVVLTFLVPFAVSLYSSLAADRAATAAARGASPDPGPR